MMKAARLLAALALLAVAGYCMWVCIADNINVGQRKTYWEAAVKEAIPSGSSRTSIDAWAHSHNVSVDELQTEHKLYIMLERMPVGGLVCREWDFIASITMNGDKSVEQKVDSSGVCL